MDAALESQILSMLNNFVEPISGLSLGALQAVGQLKIEEQQIAATLKLPFAMKSQLAVVQEKLKLQLSELLQNGFDGVNVASVSCTQDISSNGDRLARKKSVQKLIGWHVRNRLKR